jgi:hypothetical protein
MTDVDRERSGQVRWQVLVASASGDPRLLRDVVERLGVKIVTDTDKQYVVGSALESADDGPGAMKVASEICRSLSAAPELRVDLGSEVHEMRADGSVGRHHFVSVAATGYAVCIMTADVCVSTGYVGLSEEEITRPEAERIEHEYQARLRAASVLVLSAHRSAQAERVQRLLADELSPQKMRLIAEVIESAGGGIQAKLASNKQWSRFHRTLNHRDLFGDDSLHGKGSAKPPPNPMTVPEMQAFIRDVANRWFAIVAGLSDMEQQRPLQPGNVSIRTLRRISWP